MKRIGNIHAPYLYKLEVKFKTNKSAIEVIEVYAHTPNGANGIAERAGYKVIQHLVK